MPASAATWAMPLPIWPAPITPILRMVNAVSARSLRALGRSLTSVMFAIRPFYDVPCPETTATDVSLSLALFAQFLRQLRQGLIEVGNQAVVGDLEDRRLLVLVDRHDHLGVLHAGEMLDRTRNADRDVEVRRHDLAGLPDLPVVRRVARVHGGARGADRRADLVGDRLDVFGEVLARLHRAAARDDD